jgi:uncharacterized protein YjbI with pentapeptide repeats
MQIIKPLHSVFFHKCLLWNRRHIGFFSVGYFFKLSDQQICFEPAGWSSAIKAGYGKENYDESIAKTNGEFLVVGDAISKDGVPVEQMLVEVRVGKKSKTVFVSGPRCWNGTQGTFSHPLPITSQPISYRHAFGGEGYANNPVGTGITPTGDENGQIHHPLPALEYPDTPVASPDDRPAPCSLGYIAVDWPQRRQWAGTFDAKYAANDIPGAPVDIDWRFFQVAAEDQWNDGYWDPAETYSISGMHATHTVIEGALPNLVARCFVRREDLTPENISEIPLSLDTIWFFPNDDVGMVLFRGAIDVRDMFASDIKGMLCALERVSDTRRSKQHYDREFQIRSDPEKAANVFMHQAPLMPEGFSMDIGSLVNIDSSTQQHTIAEAMRAYAESVKAAITAEQAPMPVVTATDDAPQTGADNDSSTSQDTMDRSIDRVKAMAALVEQAFPVKKDAAGRIVGIDMTRIDIAKLNDIKALSQESRKSQINDVVDGFRRELAALERTPHSDAKSAMVIALTALIKTFTELPRLKRPQLQIDTQNIQEQLSRSRQELETSLANGTISDFIYSNKLAELDNGEKLIHRAVSTGMDSYRLTAHYQPMASSPHPGDEQHITDTLIARHGRGERCEGFDLAFCVIRDSSLRTLKMPAGFLEYSRLHHCDFSDSDLKGVVAVHALIEDCTFDGANLDNVNFGKSDLKRCTFNNCSTSKMILVNTALIGCTFENCDFTDTPDSFIGIQLKDCTFTGCTFNGKILNDIHIISCTFNACNLVEVIGRGASFDRCKFTQCTLTSSNIIECTIENTEFSECNLSNIRFLAETKIQHSTFLRSQMENSNFRGIQLTSTSFLDSKAEKADFSTANIVDCSFEKLNAPFSQWVASSITRSQFTRANLFTSSYLTATLDKCHFTEANLYNASFLQSTLSGTRFEGAILQKTLLEEWQP